MAVNMSNIEPTLSFYGLDFGVLPYLEATAGHPDARKLNVKFSGFSVLYETDGVEYWVHYSWADAYKYLEDFEAV